MERENKIKSTVNDLDTNLIVFLKQNSLIPIVKSCLELLNVWILPHFSYCCYKLLFFSSKSSKYLYYYF